MNTQINISFRKTMGRNLMCLEPLENSENIFIEDFRTKILNEVKDSNGALIEDATKGTVAFALGFQIDGDATNKRYWYYNCTATRPSNNSSTIEASKEPQTETVNITAAPRATDKFVRVVLEKTTENTAAYNSFFSQVYETNISQ